MEKENRYSVFFLAQGGKNIDKENTEKFGRTQSVYLKQIKIQIEL